MRKPYIASDNRASTDSCISAENRSSRVYDNMVLHIRMSLDSLYQGAVLFLFETQRAQSYPLVQLHMLSDRGGFANNHPGSMIDEEARPYSRARMNVDSRYRMSLFRHHARDKRNILFV